MDSEPDMDIFVLGALHKNLERFKNEFELIASVFM